MKYTGAGVLIIEDYKTFTGESIPSIVLGKNKANQTLSDFGGGYSKLHKEISVTASKELLEESSHLIHVSPDIVINFMYVDIPVGKEKNIGMYKVYFCKINGLSTKYYNSNRNTLQEIGAKRQWLESDAIVHIPIENIDFDDLLVRGKKIVSDVYGKKHVLSMRLRKVLKYGKDVIDKKHKEIPIMTKNDMKCSTDNVFKVELYTFRKVR